MNQNQLLKGNVKSLFFHYLVPSVSATLVTSIYVLADTIMIGKGVGLDGIAALNIILPMFSLFFGTGLLFGVGGAVYFSIARGRQDQDGAKQYFTAAFLCNLLMAVIYLVLCLTCLKGIARLLGSTSVTDPYVMEYGRFLIPGIPFFCFSTFLQTFVRNDGAPRRSMAGVITGGILNVILDYIFIFPLNMGMGGASLASVIGVVVTVIILCSHFFSDKCSLRFTKDCLHGFLIRNVLQNGFSSFLLEMATGIMTLLFNIQLIRYMGEIGVSIYGIIANSAIVVMCLNNGVSQAAQPIVATNLGAGKWERIARVKRLGTITVLAIASVICLTGFLFPEIIIDIFVNPTPQVKALGPDAIRIYFVSFLAMGINMFFSNYFQSIVKPACALLICFLRGLILSTFFLYTFPLVLGINGIWLTMPAAEFITAIISVLLMKRCGTPFARKEETA